MSALLLVACGGSAQLDAGSDRDGGGNGGNSATSGGGAAGGGMTGGSATNRGGAMNRGGSAPSSGGVVSAGGEPSRDGGSAGTNDAGDGGSAEGGAAGASTAGSSGEAGAGGTVTAPACSPIRFADANLERIVRGSVNAQTGDITAAQAKTLVYLNGTDFDIASLSGIECFPNLHTAYFNQNQISDLKPLSALGDLTLLVLSENPLGDLGPLEQLSSLRMLELEHLKLTANDLTAVAQIPQLQTLDIGGSTLDSFAPLAQGSTISALYVDFVHANAPQTVSLLTQLQLLSANGTKMNPAWLSPLTQLTYLDFESNGAIDISGLAPLVQVQTLGLTDNAVVDVSPLAGMTSLSDLDISSNQIVDLTPFAGLTALSSVDLEDNQIRSVAPLLQNTGLGLGDEFFMYGNPVDCTADAANIAALTARHVGLFTDCAL